MHESFRVTKAVWHWVVAISGVTVLVVTLLAGCVRQKAPAPPTVAAAVQQTSQSCRQCHAQIYAAWATTDHALANRPMADATEQIKAAFRDHPEIKGGGADILLKWDNAGPEMTDLQGAGHPGYRPKAILGAEPLWQPLVELAGGRWQPTDMAYDVKRREWFNVFGLEDRQPGEWGHWTGRGMNWNAMCAQCHMTGYQKHYNPTTDTYASTWVEQGVSCIQCHGLMPPEHFTRTQARPALAPPPFHGDRQRMMQTCAACHARQEPLTGKFQPGDNYFDHFHLVLPTDPAVFYPDGQQRDEDFNWASVLLSRMGGQAGVTCMDCHDPHTLKTILPVSDNQLCLQCHAAPGRVMPGGMRTPAIDPTAHSHHAAGSAGNSCVACHMPTTNYMQRAPRHDHGWLRPDPLLTKELGIPNSCTRCHQDQPVDWLIAATDRWYGTAMDGRQRRRTRAIAAVQAGIPKGWEAILELLPTEDIPLWRATMLALLNPYAGDPRVAGLAAHYYVDPDPMVRDAAVRLAGQAASSRPVVQQALQDPVRSVRLDAEWTLSPELPAEGAARRELDAYLALGSDQPVGRLLMAQDMANRGQWPAAIADMKKAVAWDPHSADLRHAFGLIYAQAGQTETAAGQLAQAAALAPQDGRLAQAAALAYHELGQGAQAEHYLRLAVQRTPTLHRAWYNLGLLLAQEGQAQAALDALAQAERLAPALAEYPYARATIFLELRDAAAAREEAAKALRLDPNMTAARQLLEQLSSMDRVRLSE